MSRRHRSGGCWCPSSWSGCWAASSPCLQLLLRSISSTQWSKNLKCWITVCLNCHPWIIDIIDLGLFYEKFISQVFWHKKCLLLTEYSQNIRNHDNFLKYSRIIFFYNFLCNFVRLKTSDKLSVNIDHVYWITTMLLAFFFISVPLIIKSQTIKEKVEYISLQFVIQFNPWFQRNKSYNNFKLFSFVKKAV